MKVINKRIEPSSISIYTVNDVSLFGRLIIKLNQFSYTTKYHYHHIIPYYHQEVSDIIYNTFSLRVHNQINNVIFGEEG